MTRRELPKALTLLALATSGGSSLPNQRYNPPHISGHDVFDSHAPQSLPKSVAGIRLIDSNIALEATRLVHRTSPPYLFNHAVRAYLFGALIAKARGLRFDEELLYVACLLHDLGLTEKFMSDLPFEIQGAQVASRFLEERGISKERVEVVWDGIAMQTSPISGYKGAEVTLVAEGAGTDVVKPDFREVKKSEIEEVVRVFPRLRFKNEFVRTCAEVVRRHPRGAAGGLMMREIAERYVADFHPPNTCDGIASSPFEE
jgi:HD domain-containing protein